MTIKGLVSVVIPAYNAEAFIASAIDSVLAQSYRLLEIIVVDDGSTDATARIAESYGAPVTCFRRENSGPPVARNRGILAAQGEYIGFLDADDLYEPGRIDLQVSKLHHNPGIDIVIGGVIREQLATGPDEPMAFKPMEPDPHTYIALGLCLMRREIFERVGVLEPSLRHCDDWDWMMRARELQVPMLMHDEIVLRVRLHWNNLTRDREQGTYYLSIMMKRSLDRRRAMFGKAQSLNKLADYRETTKSDNGDLS